MFVEYLERFLKKNAIVPTSIRERYVIFPGKNCSIEVWYDGRVIVAKSRKKKIKFRFDEKRIKKLIEEGS